MSTGFAYEDDNDDDIVIDWDKQHAAQPAQRAFDALPAGVYPVTVLEATHQISSNGNKILVLTLEVSDGDHKGRRLWERIAYVPSIAWKLRQVIRALMGVKNGGVQTFKRQELLGLGCNVMVVESEYNDRPTNEITEWFPADPPIGDASDDDVNVNWDGDF